MRKSLSVIVVWLTIKLISTADVERSGNGNSYNHYRLPTSVVPENYTIIIGTHIDEKSVLKFWGHSIITFKALQDASNITLHAELMNINETNISIISPGSDESYGIDRIEVILEYGFYIIHLNRTLVANNLYHITIPFKGDSKQGSYGYIYQNYKTTGGYETQWNLVTKFEPNNARTVFPCFDEPNMKARFRIILGHHKNYTAVSSMPLRRNNIETEPAWEWILNEFKDSSRKPALEAASEWVWDEFEESPRISTFAVGYAIISSNLLKLTTKSEEVQILTWARNDVREQVKYLHEISLKALKFYRNYFDTDFSSARLHQIIIPEFSSSLEHSGLDIHDEKIFHNDVIATSKICQFIYTYLLQSVNFMKWWSEYWAFVGIKSYIVDLCTRQLTTEPNYNITNFHYHTSNILKSDSTQSARAIFKTVTDPDSFIYLNDYNLYQKAVLVVRMLNLFLGEEAFRQAMANYIKTSLLNNGEEDDLWSSMETTARQHKAFNESFTFKQITDSWALQAGYPLVTITRDYNDNTATITQSRYLLDAGDTSTPGLNNCWFLPLSFTTQVEGNFTFAQPRNWLRCNESNPVPLVVENISVPDKWVIFNIQYGSLYRINYDYRNWILIANSLKQENFGNISILNRVQVISDIMQMAQTGKQNYSVALAVIEHLTNEHQYTPLKTAMEGVLHIGNMLLLTEGYDNFMKFLSKILPGVFNNFGLFSEIGITNPIRKHFITLFRTYSCRHVVSCRNENKNYFKRWQNSNDPDKFLEVPIKDRDLFYCIAIHNGNETDFNFLWKRYENSIKSSEKVDMIRGLSCSQNEVLLEKFFNFLSNETSNITQNHITLFLSIILNVKGFSKAVNYFKDNTERLYHFYKSDKHVTFLLSKLINKIYKEEDNKSMKEFVEEKKQFINENDEVLQNAFQQAKSNIDWLEKNYDDIMNHVNKFLENEH